MESWKSLLITFALVGLCAFLLINGIGILQTNNNVNNSIFNSPALSEFNVSMYSGLNNLSTQANSFNDQINNESSQDTTYQGALTLNTIFHIIPTFGSFIYKFIDNFSNILQSSLGIDHLTVIIISSIIMIVFILLFYKLWKWGQ